MQTQRSGRRPGRIAVAALLSLGLTVAACSKKDEGPSAVEGGGDTTQPAESGGGDSAPVETLPPPTDIVETTVAGDKPVLGGKITVSVEAEVANPWTPARMQCDQACQQRARTFFEPLAAIGDDLQVHPYLAESFTPNDDFSVWTVAVRQGITFHDGTEFNADAAIYNLQINGKDFLLRAGLRYIGKNADGSFKMEKIDDYTFTIAAEDPGSLPDGQGTPMSLPALPFSLTGQWAFMASPTWLDAVAAGSAREDEPVGTGPFVFDSYVPNEKLVVKKNPGYWQTDADGVQLPYLDEIEFRPITDSFIARDALLDGTIDSFSTANGQVIASLRDEPAILQFEQAEYGESFYVLLHVGQAGSELQSKEVRCALYQAIDKQTLIDATGGGILTPANGLFSPGQEGYLADNGDLPYDPAAAAAAIEAYEAANGPVSIIYSTTTATTSAQTAELLKGMWNAIGVDVEINQVEQSTLINDALAGAESFNAFGWRNHGGLIINTQEFWWRSTSIPLNFGRMNDPEIDALLLSAVQEVDPVARVAIAEEINRRFASECWALPTSWTIWGIPHDPNLKGFNAHVLPDESGAKVLDGAGFPGQYWMLTLYLAA
jgi:peptide/nickel transport system substrate-binding protein